MLGAHAARRIGWNRNPPTRPAGSRAIYSRILFLISSRAPVGIREPLAATVDRYQLELRDSPLALRTRPCLTLHLRDSATRRFHACIHCEFGTLWTGHGLLP